MRTKKQPRLIDIARILDVSTVTVSKALRDHPDISTEMKQRVKKIARELGYTPNFIARSLSSRRSFMIGVVVPDVAHSFFSTAIDSIYETASQKGYEIILSVSQESPDKEITSIKNLLSMRVDGLLVSISQRTKDTHIYETVKKMHVPLVFFDRCIDGLNLSSVIVDDRNGAARIVEYAIGLGYDRIAHLSGYRDISIGRERCNGYLDALRKHNIPIKDEWIIEGGFREEDGYRGLKKLYESRDMPDAIFTANDKVALGVYDCAKELGISIPADLGIIGFGDLDFARLLSPPLTTMFQPAGYIGRKAVDLLIDEILSTEESEPQTIILQTELKVRESITKKN